VVAAGVGHAHGAGGIAAKPIRHQPFAIERGGYVAGGLSAQDDHRRPPAVVSARVSAGGGIVTAIEKRKT